MDSHDRTGNREVTKEITTVTHKSFICLSYPYITKITLLINDFMQDSVPKTQEILRNFMIESCTY